MDSHKFKKAVYITKRVRDFGPDIDLTRVEYVTYSCGENFFLRLILLKKAIKSFEDARTVIVDKEKIIFQSFQEAAYALGYVTRGQEAITVFEEHLAKCTPGPELRTIFCVMTLQGLPTLCIYKEDKFR